MTLSFDHTGGLSPAQLEVAGQVFTEEGLQRRHLVVYLSGAHAYGFPSPDSDLDLKAIHVEPASRLVGLSPPPLHANRLEVIDAIKVDYSSNEIGGVLHGILAGNGNYLERVLGVTVLAFSPELGTLRPLVAASLSRLAYRHYSGFAGNQLADFRDSDAPTAKKLLYVLRTALTGVHLLLTGELIVDLTRHLEPYGFAEAQELIEAKKRGERTELDAADRDRWLAVANRALTLLESAHDESILPAEPQNRDELEQWLLGVRKSAWA